jgi:hypothetical protein
MTSVPQRVVTWSAIDRDGHLLSKVSPASSRYADWSCGLTVMEAAYEKVPTYPQ